jgi:hypothetical protein
MYGELGFCGQMRLRLNHGYDDAEPLYLRKLLAGTLLYALQVAISVPAQLTAH